MRASAEQDPERAAHARQVAIYRAMAPQQRLHQALRMNRTMRTLLATGFRMRQPGWTEARVQSAVADRILHARTGRGNPVRCPPDRHGFPYMVTGATAAILYGQPRVTNDLDVVLSLDDAGRTALLRAFPESEFYVPPESVIRAEQARSQRGHFNLIHRASGYKAGIYLAGTDPRTRGHCRNVAAYPGPMASPST